MEGEYCKWDDIDNLQRTSICLSLVSAIILFFAVLGNYVNLPAPKSIHNFLGHTSDKSSHNMMYVVLFVLSLFSVSFFSVDCKSENAFEDVLEDGNDRYNDLQKVSIGLSLVACAVLLVVGWVRMEGKGSGYLSGVLKDTVGLGSKGEKSMEHMALYVFLFVCNMFSVTFISECK
jgi:hypothetical protein